MHLNYVQQLKNDGVDGIRWDAAKHIGLHSKGCNFWNTVIDRSMYNYGEILVGVIDQHEVNQRVTDSCYGTDILNAIKGGGVLSGYGSYMQEWNLWIKLEIVI